VLNGLATLGDKRAIDVGLPYAAKGNPAPVRGSALRLLGSVGKDDPRAFTVLSETIGQAFDKDDLGIVNAAGDALVNLADSRALAVFDELLKKPDNNPNLRTSVTRFQERLRRSSAVPSKDPLRP
jgi:hypothetical protein